MLNNSGFKDVIQVCREGPKETCILGIMLEDGADGSFFELFEKSMLLNLDNNNKKN